MSLSPVPQRRLSVADMFFTEELTKLDLGTSSRRKSRSSNDLLDAHTRQDAEMASDCARLGETRPVLKQRVQPFADREASPSPCSSWDSEVSAAETERMDSPQRTSSFVSKRKYLLYTDAAHLVVDDVVS
eukprot:2605211-Rhodomonas_salina.3